MHAGTSGCATEGLSLTRGSQEREDLIKLVRPPKTSPTANPRATAGLAAR